MPLDITFTLSDRDLDRFKAIVEKAKTTTNGTHSPVEVEKAAYKIVDIAMNSDLPDFIAQRLLQLKVLLEMMKDDEWHLEDADRERIMSALAYFTDPIDLIPDHIPGIGFLDDAMFVEIIIRELKAEINAYNTFCEFRDAEESRLSELGLDPDDNRGDWIGAKRDELHAAIQKTYEESSEDDFVFHFL
jgi:uncharacterized membrane protein YkvA (DUF1232 family)